MRNVYIGVLVLRGGFGVDLVKLLYPFVFPINMLNLILKSLYFFLPAYIANMAPVLVQKLKIIKILEKPIWEQKLGSHKTWRGLIIAPIVGMFVFWLQKMFVVESLSLIDYADFSIWFGFLLGLGAILGDAVKSYYKRNAGIKEGKSWIPFDQTDFVFGGIIGGFVLYVPPAEVVLILLLVSPLLHVAANIIGYWLKINEKMF